MKWIFRSAILAFFVYAAWHFGYWLINPWQNELREGIVVPVANCFLKGGNPYDGSTDLNLGYVYGFLPALLVSGIQWLIGISSRLLEHRLLSLGSVIALAGIIECEVRRISSGKVPRLLAFAIMLSSGWCLGEVEARSDQFAMLLSVLSVVCVAGGVSWTRLVLSSLFMIFAFYSKQYAVIVGLPIFVYLLTVNWRKAIGYGFVSALILVASVLVVNAIFPLYFTMSVFCMGKTEPSYFFMLIQTVIFSWFNWPLMAIALLGLFVMPRSGWTMKGDCPARLYAFSALSAALLLSLLFGGNAGAVLSYYNQLLLPWVVLCAAASFAVIRLNRVWTFLAALAVLVFTVWHFGPYRNCSSTNATSFDGFAFGSFAFTRPLTLQENAEWIRLRDKMSAHAPNKVLTASPAVCALANELGIPYYEGGHSVNWCLGEVCRNPSELCQKYPQLISAANDVYGKWREYNKDVLGKIARGEFDAIVIGSAGESGLGIENISFPQYRASDTFNLRLGQQSYEVSLLELDRK